MYSAIDRKEISIAVLLDMSAAFDTVDHDLLIRKLEHLGIVGDALEWLKLYLSNRFHSTYVAGIRSEPLALTIGVPQGSVLGPLLFTIYIRDLGEIIQQTGMRYSIYADDVQLLVHVKPTQEEVLNGIRKSEGCLKTIESWTSENYLQLNASKTEFIAFGSKEQLAKVQFEDLVINGNTVIIKSMVRNLGVILDSTLKFGSHIDKICRSAYANLRTLHRLRNSLNNSQFALFAHALILSRIDTFPAVLYGVEKIQLKRLQRIIKATFRASYRLKRAEAVSEKMRRRGSELHVTVANNI